MSSFLHLKAGLPSQNDEEFGYLTLLALKLFIQKMDMILITSWQI